VDAILILKQMHEDVKRQFEEFLHMYNPLQAHEFWRELQPLLNRHAQAEETYVYGPLRQDSDAGAVLGEWVKQHDYQVANVQRLIQEANALEPVDRHWHTQLARIRDAVGEHTRREEEQVFPRMSKSGDASGRERLNDR
jgi:hemerythrin superfamily protein